MNATAYKPLRVNYSNRTYYLDPVDLSSYLTFPIKMYCDLIKYTITDIDVLELIKRRYIQKVLQTVSQFDHILPVQCDPSEFRVDDLQQIQEWYGQMLNMVLGDLHEKCPNPEESLYLMAQLRYLGELLNNRVHFVVTLEHVEE